MNDIRGLTGRAAPRHFRSQLGWVGVLTVIFAVTLVLPAIVFFSGEDHYAVLHLVLELTSMAVSLMIVALAWNLRHREINSQIMVIGFFSFGVLLVDLAHTLSFPGMPDFVTEATPQKAITFWLTGRAIAAIAFLVLALVPSRHWSPRLWVPGLLTIAVASAVAWWVGLYRTDWLPVMYVTGEGLTMTKRISEYILSATYLLAAILLARRSIKEHSHELAWLAASAWTLTLAELYFTLYVDVTDTFNLLGHVFKVVAYLMVFRAIFVAGVQAPYRRLDEESALLRSLIDSVPDLISYTDQRGDLIGANRAYGQRIGVDPAAVIGHSSVEVLWANGDGRPIRPQASDAPTRFDETLLDDDGVAHYFDTLQTPYFDGSGERLGVIEISRDMTAQKAADARIRHLALFDQLTGLPNRELLRDRTTASFADPSDRTQALIFLDLDGFKVINETVGHRVGDLILIETARRLSQLSGPDVDVCRFGGDEFAILSAHSSLEQVSALATQVLDAIDQPYRIDEYDLALTASAGIAIFPTDGEEFTELASRAEAAMYRAKLEGRHTYRFFSGDMLLRSAEQFALLAALRRAIENDELVVHYQPQWSLADDTLVGVEALVRWQHPERGLLHPVDFIHLAEDSGLILQIGEWVLNRAATDAAGWNEAGGAPLTVAVNVSAVQFLQTDLIERINRSLLRSGLDPRLLELEITESVAMANPESAAAVLADLHAIGIGISIDDFGTGYSSLAYLRRFHVNTLKIDRSFVEDLGRGTDNEAIVLAIIEMSRALRCMTVAEGVQTREQLNFLRAQGCDRAQGYLLGRPVPADQISDLITSTGARHHVIAQ